MNTQNSPKKSRSGEISLSKISRRIVKRFAQHYSAQSLVSSAVEDSLKSEIGVWMDTGNRAMNAVFGDKVQGVPSGKIIELFGRESTGKTTLAYKLLSIYQQHDGLGVLADVISDYKSPWAKIIGVEVGALLTLQLEEKVKVKKRRAKESEERELEGMEDLFSKMALLVRIVKKEAPGVPVLIVWDDVASTPTREELRGEYGDKGYALQARALSAGLRKLYGELHGSTVTLLALNQVRAVIGGYAVYEETPGGRALRFYSSARVRLRVVRRKGSHITCKVVNVKNKIGTPFREAEFELDFKKGITW